MYVSTREEKDDSDGDKSDQSKISKNFKVILKDTKKNVETTKPISHGSSINLHPLISKSLNAGKMVLKKDYAFDKVSEIFEEIDNNSNKLNEYNPRTSDMINSKNKMLQYLKIM